MIKTILTLEQRILLLDQTNADLAKQIDDIKSLVTSIITIIQENDENNIKE
jgi:hypothetical protein